MGGPIVFFHIQDAQEGVQLVKVPGLYLLDRPAAVDEGSPVRPFGFGPLVQLAYFANFTPRFFVAAVPTTEPTVPRIPPPSPERAKGVNLFSLITSMARL